MFFAQPWWVNLTIFVPLVSYLAWRRGLALSDRTLTIVGMWAVAFGFVEAAAVGYLRAALGVSLNIEALAPEALNDPARQLLTIEAFRETATIIMLVSLALLAARGRRERWALFLWAFAIWDIVYYLGLWLTVGWPPSLTTPDVLFLIPVPWVSHVWLPLMVSVLLLAAVLVRSRSSKTDSSR